MNKVYRIDGEDIELKGWIDIFFFFFSEYYEIKWRNRDALLTWRSLFKSW